jgi:hypothetical protein
MAFAWKTKIAFGAASLNSCRATDIRRKFMTTETEVSPAMWWRGKVAELREVAGRTTDPELRRRLFDVADRWEESADHMGRHAATLVA